MKIGVALLVSSLVMSLIGSAAADIAPEPLMTGGNTMAPRQKGVPVEMAWEEVDINPSAGKNRVVAVFDLRNTGDKAVKFEVGFPSYNQIPLQDFQVEVDGKTQAATEKSEDKGDKKGTFLCWMCWEMEFAGKQERKVKVSYWVETEHIYPHLEYEQLPNDLKKTVWPYNSGYVLRTGVGWEGNIGKAVIRLHYGDEVKKSNTSHLQPDMGWQYDAKTDVDTLSLKDFEPGDESPEAAFDTGKYDVLYQFTLSSPKEEVDLLRKAAKEKKLDPWALEYLLHWIEEGGNPRKIEDLRDDLYGEEDPAVKTRLTERLAQEAKAFVLPDKDKKELVIETLEHMVPPGGPEFDQNLIGPGAEHIVRDAYGRLFAHYRENSMTAKALVVGEHFRKFLRLILDRDEQWKDQAGRAGDEYRELETENGQVEEYLEKNGPGEKLK